MGFSLTVQISVSFSATFYDFSRSDISQEVVWCFPASNHDLKKKKIRCFGFARRQSSGAPAPGTVEASVYRRDLTVGAWEV